VTGDSEEIAYKKGINWMLQHPQKIGELVELYYDELNFYYLMTEKSKTEKERELYKGVFLQRMRQSDGYNFKMPDSPLENCYYALILGLRKWSRTWDTRDDETDSRLLYIVNEHITKNTNVYISHYPIELIFIDYISRKFDIKFTDYPRPEYNWWEFLNVVNDKGYSTTGSTEISFYDILVAYSVTHVIFIDSDYGLRHLDRQNYEREYQYFTGNMEKFISNEYTSLVSEFISSLKILRATDNPAYEKAVAYVISSQNDDGSWNDYNPNMEKHAVIASLLALSQD
jgi:hypothetical protein